MLSFKKISFWITISSLFVFASPVFAVQVDFTPELSLSEEYTDNVDLDSVNEREEWITTISPGFSLTATEKTSVFDLSYTPSYVIYKDDRDLDTWLHTGSVGFQSSPFRNTSIEIRDTYEQSDDPVNEDDNTLRRGRQKYETNTASIDISHQYGREDSVSMGYTNSTLENEDPAYEDNMLHTVTAGWTSEPASHLLMDIDLTYTRGEYDESDDYDNWRAGFRLTKEHTPHFSTFFAYNHTFMDYREGESDDYQIYDPSIGIDYAFSDDSSLTIGVGYFYQDRDAGEDESGLTITGDIGKSWQFRTGSVGVSFSSGYEEEYGGAENLGFSIYYMGACTGDISITRNLTADGSLSYRHDDYTDQPDDRVDKTGEINTGLAWQATRQINIRLSYSFRNLDSTEPENEYHENRGMLTVRISPDQPFRFSD